MKLYGNNRLLAEQLLETAFAILRNEGLQPAECLAMAYGQLTDGIDVTPVQQAVLHDYLRRMLAAHDRQSRSEPTDITCNAPNDSIGGLT
jgi:hypothetical protein